MTNQLKTTSQINSSYIKYRNWVWWFSLLTLVVVALIMIIGFSCQQEQWSKATIIIYDQAKIVCFHSKDDYQKWTDAHYSQVECICQNQRFYFKIDKTIPQKAKDEFKNAIFVFLSHAQAEQLKNTSEVVIYNGNEPWLIYFFHHVL